MQARPFETNPTLNNLSQPSAGVGRGKKLRLKETELAPLKAQIDKANAARAFKERFSSSQTAKVLTIGDDGIARRQRKAKDDEELEDDSEVDDIDNFLAELDMKGRLPAV
jgi:hypothetical protein